MHGVKRGRRHPRDLVGPAGGRHHVARILKANLHGPGAVGERMQEGEVTIVGGQLDRLGLLERARAAPSQQECDRGLDVLGAGQNGAPHEHPAVDASDAEAIDAALDLAAGGGAGGRLVGPSSAGKHEQQACRRGDGQSREAALDRRPRR